MLIAVLASFVTVASIGCGGANGSSTGSATTSNGTSSSGTTSTGTTSAGTTTTTPVVPAGWTNVDRPYVSYDYPSAWKLTENTSTTGPYVDAGDPSQPTKSQVQVQFVPGYPNNSYTGSGDQCADAEQALNEVYTNTFQILATNPAVYPRTQVTWLYLPSSMGRLGGASGTVSVSYQASVASAVNYLVDLEAVPRTGGLYLVAFWSPDYYSTPSIEKTFYSTLVLKYPFLPKGSNCSSLN